MLAQTFQLLGLQKYSYLKSDYFIIHRMAFNETLSDRIREALSPQENVIEKRMFGGICYMVNDKMCVGVIGEDMMCRVGEEAFESAIERPGCREMGMRTREDFQYWINLCLAYNPQANASRKKTAAKK